MALMENGGLSIADAMALAKDDNNGFVSTWTWVFFLFFLLAWAEADYSAAAITLLVKEN